jgi:predicted ATP-grasp superfamily ATP-dependent carboligase
MIDLKYTFQPELTRPTLIMSFSGWADAGEASTGAMSYLERRLEPVSFAEISADPFFDFTQQRPEAIIKNGRLEHLDRPRLKFTYHQDQDADLILFQSPEPHLNWSAFVDGVFSLIRQMGVQTVVTLGGFYGYFPHWIEPTITAVHSDDRAETVTAGLENIEPGEYNGPVSIHTILMTETHRQHGPPVVGLWGGAPVYVQTGNIKIHLALVEAVKHVTGLALDTSDLTAQIADMDLQIEELVKENPRLKQYLDELEIEYQKEDGRPRPGRVQSEGDPVRGKVIDFHEFVNRQSEDDS